MAPPDRFNRRSAHEAAQQPLGLRGRDRQDQARAWPSRLLPGPGGLDPRPGGPGEPGAPRQHGYPPGLRADHRREPPAGADRRPGRRADERREPGKGLRASHGHHNGALRHRRAGPKGHRDPGRGGLRRPPVHRGHPHRPGGGGGAAAAPGFEPARADPRSARGGPDLRALQARGPDVQERGHRGRHRRSQGGGSEVIAMAGPCSVESREQVGIVARTVAASGARVLRGGAFKPRTSPYSFQGHGEEALRWMREAADQSGLAVVSEVMDLRTIEMMMGYVDCLQVGARNMQNYDLLRELGKVRKPVLLKRGLSATIEEWLLSAEYILAGGNHQVVLCERGITWWL